MKLIKTADFLAEFEADRLAATPSAAPAVILNICSNQILLRDVIRNCTPR